MATDTKPRTRKVDASIPGKTTGRPVSSPRHTRPIPQTKPPERIRPNAPVPERPDRTDRRLREQRRGGWRPEGASIPAVAPKPAVRQRGPGAAQSQHRMPFMLLLVGLLGGAIVSLLVISTTLDAGAYRITNLTNENTMISKRIQVVSNDVANEQNPATIMGEAYRLGMRYDKYLRFIDTKAGKISSSNPVAP